MDESAASSPRLVQDSSSRISYRRTWTKESSNRFLGRPAKVGKVAGASATIVSSSTSVSFVTTMASNRGWARVYVNGHLVARVNLKSSTTRYRVVAWRATWPTAASRTIRVYVEGTQGGRASTSTGSRRSTEGRISTPGPRFAGPRCRHAQAWEASGLRAGLPTMPACMS